MTKKVRIENADTSNHKVRVTIQRKDADGNWADNESTNIDYPTMMTEQYIHSGARIIIEEVNDQH